MQRYRPLGWALTRPGDRASSRISLTEFALNVTDNPQRPLAVIAVRAAVWQAGSGVEASDGDQAADRDRYLLLKGEPTSERWRRMIQRAEAALRPQD